MAEKPEVIIINESDFRSIFSDIFTFGALVGSFWINYNFLGDSTILTLMLAGMFLLFVYEKTNTKVKTMKSKQAFYYLKRKYEPFNKADLLDEAREALEFYALEGVWKEQENGHKSAIKEHKWYDDQGRIATSFELDNGEIAKHALTKIKEEYKLPELRNLKVNV